MSNEIAIVGEYYRSDRGDVIHLAHCPSMGGAVRWNYADAMSLHEVAGFVNGTSWMRLCVRCWPAAALPVSVGESQ